MGFVASGVSGSRSLWRPSRLRGVLAPTLVFGSDLPQNQGVSCNAGKAKSAAVMHVDIPVAALRDSTHDLHLGLRRPVR